MSDNTNMQEMVDKLADRMYDNLKMSEPKEGTFLHKGMIPTAVMGECVKDLGIDKEVFSKSVEAINTISCAQHHASARKLRDFIIAAKSPEEKDKQIIHTRGELDSRGLKIETTITGHSTGMSVPRKDHPATPYENWGRSSTKITMPQRINKQRELDAEYIKKAYTEE